MLDEAFGNVLANLYGWVQRCDGILKDDGHILAAIMAQLASAHAEHVPSRKLGEDHKPVAVCRIAYPADYDPVAAPGGSN